ncbi:MAG: amidase family protein, partial [Gemmatimonadaceae bacterium]
MNTRRQFLIRAPIGLLGAAAACSGTSEGGGGGGGATSAATPVTSTTPGSPSAFGTSPVTGPEVSSTTFAEAEKLAQVSYSDAERQVMAESWRRTLASTLERRVGPRKITIPDELSPAMVWNPAQAVGFVAPTRDRFVRVTGDPGPLPASDDDIAFAPVTSLSRWIEKRALTSERLTQIYLARIDRHDPKIRSIITLNRDGALTAAKAADAEIAAGKYRGPLHGIPFGVKDLLD